MLLVHSASIVLPSSPSAQFTRHQYLHRGGRHLYVGLSTGTIAIFRRRVDSFTGHEVVDGKPTLLHGHTGAVTCLVLAEGEGVGTTGALLLSASADRTVRVWDPAVRDPSKACVQTLRAHGGTVTAMAYAEGMVMTSSTDGTIKVWRPDDGRELMLYPWLVVAQTLADLDG
jgi:WD40 repeat protein